MPPLVPTDPSEPAARRARPPRVLVVRTGQASAEVERTVGDYPEWFRRHLAPLGVDQEEVAVFQGQALPYGGRYDGIILTGSGKSVRDEDSWMPVVGRWALAMAAHTPVLAVCFGHQLVGEALGGRVERNPAGPEDGMAAVALTEAGRRDPLFEGLPAELCVPALHEDLVLREPAPHRFVRLAGNPHTPLQAYAVGPWLRAVQFHPELSARQVQAVLDAHGQAPTVPVVESDHGRVVMANWVRRFVRRAEGQPGPVLE
ncbi:GMP synthase [Myxococcota bacterium]|nr:GMP synthase [Myxococcota bacterium]